MKRVIALCIVLFAIGWALTIATQEPEPNESPSQDAAAGSPVSVAAAHVEALDTPLTVATIKNVGTNTTTFRIVKTVDGTTVKDLPAVDDVFLADYPLISADDKSIYFTTGNGDQHNIAAQSIDDGSSAVVVAGGQQPSLSPSGKYLAFGRKGVIVLRNLETKADYTFDSARLPDSAKGVVLAGVRSITWLSDSRFVALVSSDFERYQIVIADVSDVDVSVEGVRDAPKGQVIGPAEDADEVIVVDDMTKGVIVHNVVLKGPAAIGQRYIDQNDITVWDITNDGKQLLLSDAKELRRESIDDPSQRFVFSNEAYAAGF